MTAVIMNSSTQVVLTGLLLLSVSTRAGAEVVETRSLDDRIAVTDRADLEVVVDNIFGPVHVTGHDEPVVELAAIERIVGDTAADVERARAEVSLQTIREEGRIAFLVRRGDGCDCNCGCRWDGYIVEYDIQLRVPREADIDISTVNNGDIVVENVHGSFRVSNVNGAVALTGLRESGNAKTVNGDLSAAFERSPGAATAFETINGEIDVVFPSDTSADLLFKTTRGEIWTDFDVSALPAAPVPQPQTSQGRRATIRADRYATVRVGRGGPAHTFETMNGDIYVRESR